MATTDGAVRVLGHLDRGLYALFSRHADRARHDRDRERYRAANLGLSFERYLARVYGASWSVLLVAFVWTVIVVLALPASLLDALGAAGHAAVPVVNRLPVPSLARPPVAVLAGVAAGGFGKWLTVRAGSRYLRWRASVRRGGIERTLPGAVRYMRVLASGSGDRRTMLRKVAEQDAYGETAVAFRRALNDAALTGSLDDGLETVARDTPSRSLLAPFLLKFREHANQSADALEGYLQMESRMLSHRQSRSRQRAADFLELLAELFIVLLVLPSLLVIVLTVLSALAPGLSAPVATPLGTTTVRSALVYGSAAFVLVVGAGAALVVESLRPPGQGAPDHPRPERIVEAVRTVLVTPASAAVAFLPVAAGSAALLVVLGYRPENVVLLGYAAYGVPIGLVAVRRARLDDAKDREMKDFVHAVSGHVSLGRPFGEAVGLVAREVDLGRLQDDVDDLAFALSLTTAGERGTNVRAAALGTFVEQVDTRLAEQTVGLVTGALDVGSDTEEVFETLQTEVGRLHHEKKALRSAMLIYVAVGWTTALLVVGIMVAVNGYVLDGFSQLSAVAGASHGIALDPTAVQPARDQRRFYVVTQATMLASGWFAGAASRGRYEALLHSGVLVLVCYVVFAGAGML
ncbi:MAG: type II secretion system F family protein [Haloplanus sp.]